MSFDYYIPAGTPVLDKATGDITYLETPHMGAYPYPNNYEKPVAVTSVKAARE